MIERLKMKAFANFVGDILDIPTKFEVQYLPETDEQIGYTILNGARTTFIYLNPLHPILKFKDRKGYDDRVLLGTCVHEVLHSKYTHPEYMVTLMQRTPIVFKNVFQMINNILEDFTIESRAIVDLDLTPDAVDRLESLLNISLKGREPLKMLNTMIYTVWDKQPPVLKDNYPQAQQILNAMIAFTDIGPLPVGSDMDPDAEEAFLKIAKLFMDAIWLDSKDRINVALEAYRIIEPFLRSDANNANQMKPQGDEGKLGTTQGKNSTPDSKPNQDTKSTIEKSPVMRIRKKILKRMTQDNNSGQQGTPQADPSSQNGNNSNSEVPPNKSQNGQNNNGDKNPNDSGNKNGNENPNQSNNEPESGETSVDGPTGDGSPENGKTTPGGQSGKSGSNPGSQSGSPNGDPNGDSAGNASTPCASTDNTNSQNGDATGTGSSKSSSVADQNENGDNEPSGSDSTKDASGSAKKNAKGTQSNGSDSKNGNDGADKDDDENGDGSGNGGKKSDQNGDKSKEGTSDTDGDKDGDKSKDGSSSDDGDQNGDGSNGNSSDNGGNPSGDGSDNGADESQDGDGNQLDAGNDTESDNGKSSGHNCTDSGDSHQDSQVDLSPYSIDDNYVTDLRDVESEIIKEDVDLSSVIPDEPAFVDSGEKETVVSIEEYRDPEIEARKYGSTPIKCRNYFTTSVNDETMKVYESVCSNNREMIAAIKRALERIIADEEDAKSLAKSGHFEVDRYCKKKGTTLEVFTKHKDKTKTDSAVCILADVSGSMGGAKISQEKIILACLAEALSKVGIPFKVITFCDREGFVQHHHYVNYKNSKSERAALMTITAGGCNFDGYSIRYALKDIQKNKAKNKLLIIISDGQPNPSHPCSNAVMDARDAVVEARRRVKVCGIALGVSSDSYTALRTIYQKKDEEESFLSVRSERDLVTALPKLITKEVKRW